MTVVLVFVIAISFVLNEKIEGSTVATVIAVNTVIGLIQEYRAEKAIQSLSALTTPKCKVIRDGRGHSVKATTLVKGDLVSLVAGDIVPADLRLVQAINLSTDEAHLTGEAGAIAKKHDAIFDDADIPVGDRVNLVFSGSTVISGRATGIVVSTGMETQVGQIAELLSQKKRPPPGMNRMRTMMHCVLGFIRTILGLTGTPLLVSLNKLALVLFGLAIVLVLVVFSICKWEINDDVLLYGIYVGVAIIPESLSAVLTICLAVAARAMAKGNVVVRHLAALEAVGATTHVCSDKTGTITQGRMVTRKVWLRDGLTGVTQDISDPYDPNSGSLTWSGSLAPGLFSAFLKTINLCNNATVTHGNKSSDWCAMGEPTEIALKVFAMRHVQDKSKDGNLIAEHPFDSTCKLMTVVYGTEVDPCHYVHTKGAVEVLLPILDETEQFKAEITAKAELLAAEGLRVLCIADKVVENSPKDAQDRQKCESRLRFLGLVGMYDPPRLEAAGAVTQLHQAGLSVHMLTGDHIQTATAIAKEVGILSHESPLPPSAVMAASDFAKLSDDEVDALDNIPFVIARCTPETKVKVIEAIHRRNGFCIMTGDGANDAPALKKADVGIAMGERGSDVAKEAADMILTDDNFSSIVTAIREGRRLTDNIQKFLLHLQVANIGQIILLLVGLTFLDFEGDLVFALSGLAVLWVNLVTSSPLAIGLGLEEAQDNILRRPPRSRRMGIFSVELICDQFVYGISMGALSLAAFMIVAYGDIGYHLLEKNCAKSPASGCGRVLRARGATFATLSFLFMVMAWEVKHSLRSLFTQTERGSLTVFYTVYRNRFLFWSVIAGIVATILVIHIPHVNNRVFEHRSLG
ncbi:potassium/sodium efflux P-type ATPase [Cordyceps militaris CM01]|uniref:Potassium/sodium efflux P-type ATPase n=1 Tax=Cordyceps militaris (strain CM01) TaxID=983644 RepID=G3JS92_CORMM|nr:potassium/sodium efflux P-type ATPase [Cordyceps militaris CM01]EGX88791.1 potassium/sodium efflux P-type ATPase [Cordyceps militaris CM01]